MSKIRATVIEQKQLRKEGAELFALYLSKLPNAISVGAIVETPIILDALEGFLLYNGLK